MNRRRGEAAASPPPPEATTITPRADTRLSHRRVLGIALPILLANITVPILGIVDTGVIGQLGTAAPLGAVGLGATIVSALYWMFGFLRMGTTGLTAQARGADDTAEMRALLVRALMAGFLAGLLIFVLQGPLLGLAFGLSPASAEVEGLARDYIGIRVFSAPAAIALYGINGWLIALERTRRVLLLQIWMNGLNVALDFWFVLGLGWGVTGVALATFLAEWSALALGLWLCRPGLGHVGGFAWAHILDTGKLRRMLVVNSDIMLRSLLLSASFTSFLFLAGGLGDVTLAADQVLMQFFTFSAFMLDGFAFAAEALVGQAFGAGRRMALRRAALLASFWGGIVVVGLSAAYWLAGALVIDGLTTSPAVRAEARLYLPWVALAPAAGIASFMLDGIFIGATRTRDMRNMMILSASAYAVAAASFLPLWGNHGLWAALMVFFGARAVTLGWKYPALEASVAPMPEKG